MDIFYSGEGRVGSLPSLRSRLMFSVFMWGPNYLFSFMLCYQFVLPFCRILWLAGSKFFVKLILKINFFSRNESMLESEGSVSDIIFQKKHLKVLFILSGSWVIFPSWEWLAKTLICNYSTRVFMCKIWSVCRRYYLIGVLTYLDLLVCILVGKAA